MTYTLERAATVVVIRGGANDLEVLLLRRSNELKFAPGIWVFPGGALEEADRKQGRDEQQVLSHTGVRETEEETAIVLDPKDLIHFMQYTTPMGNKRFETWFFIASVDGAGAQVHVDGGEIVDYCWMKPEQALSSYDRGELPIFLPTGLVLARLAMLDNCQSAARCVAKKDPEKVIPRGVLDGDEAVSLYPGDIAYEGLSIDVDGLRHRAYYNIQTGVWSYEHTLDAEEVGRLDGGYFLTR